MEPPLLNIFHNGNFLITSRTDLWLAFISHWIQTQATYEGGCFNTYKCQITPLSKHDINGM